MTTSSIYLNPPIKEHLRTRAYYHTRSRRIGCTVERYDAIVIAAQVKIRNMFESKEIKEIKKKIQTGYYIEMKNITKLYTCPESFDLDQNICDAIKDLSAVELIALIETAEAEITREIEQPWIYQQQE
jgi:hypothetical protein